MRQINRALACSLLLLALPCFAAAPEQGSRQAVVKDIADMLVGDGKPSIEQTARGLFLQTAHCGALASRAVALLQERLAVPDADDLLQLFERIVCAKTDDDRSIAVAQFGDRVADPIRKGLVTYSGDLELGGWEPELDSSQPVSEARVSLIGMINPTSEVSLWEVKGNDEVRVWFAPFRVAPSDAETFFFEHRDGRWIWTGHSSAIRL
ncbi:MAG TPA: hypothetical protein VGD21_02570 [Lysobacter sp.]